MRQRSTVTMTMRELDKLKCIQAVVDGELRAGQAAGRLQMSSRQVRRLAQRYRLEGPVGLISRHRSRPSNRRLKEDRENQVARILRESYPDFGPTLAMEKLAERHQLVLAKETVRRIRSPPGCGSPASCGHRRSNSRARDGPVWENSSRSMAVSITGLRTGGRCVRRWCLWMTRPAA